MRYNIDIEHFERLLREQRAELLERRDRLMDDRRSVLERRCTESIDDATRTGELDSLETLFRAEIQKLRAVEQALERLELGEYGVCEYCGSTLNPRRLEAIPFARVCVRCVESMSSAAPAG